jgi:hypothetical protein
MELLFLPGIMNTLGFETLSRLKEEKEKKMGEIYE